MRVALVLPLLVLALACDETDPAATASDGSTTGVGAGGSAGGSAAGGSSAGGSAAGGSSAGGNAAGGNAAGGSAAGGGPCAQLSDEFEDATTLGCWSLRHQVEGGAAQYEVLDIAETVAGQLTIEPTGSGWFGDNDAPLVFKTLTGDFVVETYVAALDEGDASMPPSDDYHSAGLLLRDAASMDNSENWIMYNIGYQETFVGTERKTTVNSSSTLLLEQGVHRGRLRVCRVGSSFRVLRLLDGESSWSVEGTYQRDDLPSSLQVGLVTNAWPPGGAAARNMQARFDYIHFGSLTTLADCEADIVPL